MSSPSHSPGHSRSTSTQHASSPSSSSSTASASSSPSSTSTSSPAVRSRRTPFSEQRVECGHTPANGCRWALQLQAAGQYTPCGSQQRKLMLRHEWATTLHRQCDGKHSGLSRDDKHNHRILRDKRKLMLSSKPNNTNDEPDTAHPQHPQPAPEAPSQQHDPYATPLRTPPYIDPTTTSPFPTTDTLSSVSSQPYYPLDVLLSALSEPLPPPPSPPSPSPSSELSSSPLPSPAFSPIDGEPITDDPATNTLTITRRKRLLLNDHDVNLSLQHSPHMITSSTVSDKFKRVRKSIR